MGANIPGKARQLLNYPSVVGYGQICDEVAQEGYRGFVLTGWAPDDDGLGGD